MAVQVPSSYTALVQAAASATGLPYNVVAAQANLESGFNASAVSSAGAEGWLQFLPSTYNEYAGAAGVPQGTEFNPVDEEKVYVQYMKSLLGEYHGDVLEALNAYNGAQYINGQPNTYGPDILSAAGSGNVTVPGTSNSSGTTGVTTTSFPGGSLDPLNWFSDLGNTAESHLKTAFGYIFSDFKTVAIRLGLIIMGMVLIYAGLRSLTSAPTIAATANSATPDVGSLTQLVAPESFAAQEATGIGRDTRRRNRNERTRQAAEHRNRRSKKSTGPGLNTPLSTP